MLPFRAIMAAIPLVLSLFVAISPAWADIPRPLDERATARLLVAALTKADPSLEVVLGSRDPAVYAKVPGGQSHDFRVDKLHRQLRAEPDGQRREDLLAAYVAKELAVMKGVAQGTLRTGFDRLAEFEPDSVIPVLRRPDPDASWELPSLLHLTFPGGLFVAWLQDRAVTGGGISVAPGPISSHLARALQLDKLKLRQLGIVNLEARLARMSQQRDGRFLILSLDGRFGASLMVVSSYWKKMASNGQVLTAAIPRSDELIVIADANAAEITALRKRVQATQDAGGDDLLSTDLFRWTGNEWQVLPP